MWAWMVLVASGGAASRALEDIVRVWGEEDVGLCKWKGQTENNTRSSFRCHTKCQSGIKECNTMPREWLNFATCHLMHTMPILEHSLDNKKQNASHQIQPWHNWVKPYQSHGVIPKLNLVHWVDKTKNRGHMFSQNTSQIFHMESSKRVGVCNTSVWLQAWLPCNQAHTSVLSTLPPTLPEQCIPVHGVFPSQLCLPTQELGPTQHLLSTISPLQPCQGNEVEHQADPLHVATGLALFKLWGKRRFTKLNK